MLLFTFISDGYDRLNVVVSVNREKSSFIM